MLPVGVSGLRNGSVRTGRPASNASRFPFRSTAAVVPLTIGQIVEMDQAVKAYAAWLREQLVLDPIGEGFGTGKTG